MKSCVRAEVNTNTAPCIARENRNPPFPLWDLDICGDYALSVLDWFPRRLCDTDGNQLILAEMFHGRTKSTGFPVFSSEPTWVVK